MPAVTNNRNQWLKSQLTDRYDQPPTQTHAIQGPWLEHDLDRAVGLAVEHGDAPPAKVNHLALSDADGKRRQVPPSLRRHMIRS
jgi:hypothetical protein